MIRKTAVFLEFLSGKGCYQPQEKSGAKIQCGSISSPYPYRNSPWTRKGILFFKHPATKKQILMCMSGLMRRNPTCRYCIRMRIRSEPYCLGNLTDSCTSRPSVSTSQIRTGSVSPWRMEAGSLFEIPEGREGISLRFPVLRGRTPNSLWMSVTSCLFNPKQQRNIKFSVSQTVQRE